MGGANHQNVAMGGKCGICGDPFDGPWPHEAPGGRYANGHIVKTYTQGQSVKVAIEITANHLGYFTFKLCPNNNVKQDPKQDCFDEPVLTLLSSQRWSWFLFPDFHVTSSLYFLPHNK